MLEYTAYVPIDMELKKETKLQVVMRNAYLDFGKGLNAFAFYKMHNQASSVDLVEDTYTKTLKYLERGGEIETMKAFLYHVLRGLIIDFYRKTKSISLDTMIEQGFEPSAVDCGLVNSIDGRTAMTLISQLSPKYENVMSMRYIRGLSLAEMAEITGETRNAVAVQVHRGIEKLKVLFGE